MQKEMVAGGKANLVGDLQLYNTAAELTRIMGHKNPDKFFNDPSAINPQTGQLLHPPPAPPTPPPDPKLLAVQARAQLDQAQAAHQAQIAKLAVNLVRGPLPSCLSGSSAACSAALVPPDWEREYAPRRLWCLPPRKQARG